MIAPEDYARWRESYVGPLTERIEQGTIFQLAGKLRGKSLLDLGCGDGTYSIAASQLGARVTGVQFGRHDWLCPTRGGSLRCRHRMAPSFAESLPYDSDTLDIILAVTILCFIKDPLQKVRELSRVLRPGGSFVIGEVGRHSSWALSRRVAGFSLDTAGVELAFHKSEEQQKLKNQLAEEGNVSLCGLHL